LNVCPKCGKKSMKPIKYTTFEKCTRCGYELDLYRYVRPEPKKKVKFS